MAEVTKNPSINQVIAENLRYWMEQSQTLKTQMALAVAAGVAQTTVSNYLNPKQRLEGSTGKDPSPKVTELVKIADALGVGVWVLLRPMASSTAREFYRKIEEAYETAISEDPSGITGNTGSAPLDEAQDAPLTTGRASRPQPQKQLDSRAKPRIHTKQKREA